MPEILTILEVSQKQAYIFGSKRLRENAWRSWEIGHVTSEKFFRETAGALYGANNLVYSGGGRTILRFHDRETAVAFSKRVTEAAMRQYGGLELFVTHRDYEEDKTPAVNLKALSQALERKKAERAASFRQLDFGVETLDGETLRPVPTGEGKREQTPREPVDPPSGYTFPGEFEDLARQDNFIAVVHLDGNSMGKRVENIYKDHGQGDWETCRDSLRRFSEGIQRDFEDAFSETVLEVVDRLQLPPGPLPIRPVILAGDDVCFVTKGSIGLECARIFLEKLTAKTNEEDRANYAACAGVAMVHKKYPFHRAYELSEELCSSAKKFGAGLDQDGRVSAMDWHIEFGQLKDSLAELRQDYETEDGNRLDLRPVAVHTPESIEKSAGVRSYQFFQGLCRSIQEQRSGVVRSKLKELRTALKQGEVESRFYLRDREIAKLMYTAFPAEYSDWLKRQVMDKEAPDKEAFRAFPNEGYKRCLYFDAIELADHWECLGEVEA